MIVSFFRYGRLGNRLFSFSNLIAFSEVYKVPILMPSFADYGALSPYFERNRYCAYGFTHGEVPSILGVPMIFVGSKLRLVPTVRFWEGRYVYFDKEDSDDARVREMASAPVVVFEGWDFCSREAIRTAREKLLTVFQPREEVLTEVHSLTASMRERADVLVGVHIRWGDYRGTDRFFSLTDYVEKMKELRYLLLPKKAAFVVFSPEEIPAEQLPEESFVCSRNAIADMYSLAECDYLVGPSSTFSMWASYYGGHPLFVMRPGKHFRELSEGKMATP